MQTLRVACRCGWRREVESESNPATVKALEVAAAQHEAAMIRQSHKHETTEVLNLG